MTGPLITSIRADAENASSEAVVVRGWARHEVLVRLTSLEEIRETTAPIDENGQWSARFSMDEPFAEAVLEYGAPVHISVRGADNEAGTSEWTGHLSRPADRADRTDGGPLGCSARALDAPGPERADASDQIQVPAPATLTIQVRPAAMSETPAEMTPSRTPPPKSTQERKEENAQQTKPAKKTIAKKTCGGKKGKGKEREENNETNGLHSDAPQKLSEAPAHLVELIKEEVQDAVEAATRRSGERIDTARETVQDYADAAHQDAAPKSNAAHQDAAPKKVGEAMAANQGGGRNENTTNGEFSDDHPDGESENDHAEETTGEATPETAEDWPVALSRSIDDLKEEVHDALAHNTRRTSSVSPASSRAVAHAGSRRKDAGPDRPVRNRIQEKARTTREKARQTAHKAGEKVCEAKENAMDVVNAEREHNRNREEKSDGELDEATDGEATGANPDESETDDLGLGALLLDAAWATIMILYLLIIAAGSPSLLIGIASAFLIVAAGLLLGRHARRWATWTWPGLGGYVLAIIVLLSFSTAIIRMDSDLLASAIAAGGFALTAAFVHFRT